MIWFLYLPLDIVTSLLAFPLAPIIALFADGNGDVTLSKNNPLRLWLTPDNPIEGDRGHYERWADFVAKHPKIGLYVQRTFWLWRNKAYGWSWNVLNTWVYKDDKLYSCGNPKTGDKPYYSGVWAATMSKNPFKARWMLYIVFPSFPGKCFRLYLGWKFQSALKMRIAHDADPAAEISDYNAMFVSTINPFKTRR